MRLHASLPFFRRWFSWIWCLAFWAGGVASLAGARVPAAAPRWAEADGDLRALLDLVDRRLALMPEVAAWKWARGQPITDAARERQVLDLWEAQARAVKLEAGGARAFLEVQIALARAIQERCVEGWREQGRRPEPARDLDAVLRPQLDALAGEMLRAAYLAAGAEPVERSRVWSERVAVLRRHAGTNEVLLARLGRALGELRLAAPPTWEVVQRVGVLRIGTTGDYAPFSSDQAGVLQGVDIDLCAALARHWGVEARFVRTTWPTLMQDLEARRFDLAAAGVSITPERRARADFSVAYFQDGKTPIARCADAARFATLEGIDQPGVRVIVNPGGTNERFARERVRRATIIVHPDNRTIFGEILAGRADVMFTDGIEVRLQRRRHPELCGTMAEPLTRAGKAVLLPKHSDLTARVDAWLAPQAESGALAESLESAVASSR